MTKSKAVILGAGRGQIPSIEICHKYGIEVIAVTPKGDWPAIPLADKVYYSDVKDIDALMKIVEAEKPAGIFTEQLDAAVYPCAYVAERTGLRGITSEVAIKFTNKYEMRRTARNAGVSVPECFTAGSIDEALKGIESSEKLRFPLMMKPVDNAASHGVYMLHDESELRQKFQQSISWSLVGQVIIEQVISGREYVVDAWTHDYRTTNLIIGLRKYFDVPDTFIPSATLFVDGVSFSSHEEELVKAANKKLVESAGLEFGITHGEYFYVPEEDDVYLVEIAARGGGVFTSSDLIPGASGVNAEELLVREVMGIGNPEVNITPGAAAYFCYLTPEGVVEELSGMDEAVKIPGVRKAFFDNISLGMQTAPITDKASRKGPILVQGKSRAECMEIISRVKEVLSIKVRTPDGLTGVIW